MVEVQRKGAVHVVHMDEGENRFNPPFIAALHSAVDAIEAFDGPCALVTTGSGKFYSNGLDLDWLGTSDDPGGFLDRVHGLLGRLLGLDVFTVAAVNGHAFAAGAMLASVHDCVIMREDRGYWCLPEVDLGLPLTPEMYAALAAHVEPRTLARAALTGHRFSAQEAVEAGLASEAVPEDEVLTRAIELATAMATKNRSVIGTHKLLLYGQAIATATGRHRP
jgi:enoyl-CoA hydratase/carnithine racemase